MEIWKDIPGFEGKYQASNEGGVRSLDRLAKTKDRSGVWRYRRAKGRVLKPTPNNSGYLGVGLGGKSNTLVHRIVALTFIENPDQKPFVNHKNSNKIDNRVENLEWCTGKENSEHAWKNGRCEEIRKKTTERVRRHLRNGDKLREKDVLGIRALRNIGFSQNELAELFKVSQAHVWRIVNFQSWENIKPE